MSNNFKFYEHLIRNLTSQQKYIPMCAVCANTYTLPKNIINEIINFLNVEELKFINFASSSVGARHHCLYRADNGIIYIIYITNNRDVRIYYLTPKILSDIFEGNEIDFELLSFKPMNEVLFCIKDDKTQSNNWVKKTIPRLNTFI